MTDDEALKLKQNDWVNVGALIATVSRVYRGQNDDVFVSTNYGDFNASVCKPYPDMTKNFKVFGKIQITSNTDFERLVATPMIFYVDFAVEIIAENEEEVEMELKNPNFAEALKKDFPNAMEVRVSELHIFEENDDEKANS
ncbi:MAG: hypothetical protein M3209_09495 [Acidobacteriota bacterium]|nr:hypothetical protein [Acidobacteriota bacterium]